jgi:hypothetical protein
MGLPSWSGSGEAAPPREGKAMVGVRHVSRPEYERVNRFWRRFVLLPIVLVAFLAGSVGVAHAAIVKVVGTPKEPGRDGPERQDSISVNGDHRVVMSLRGDNFPDLADGDTIKASAEVEVSTRDSWPFNSADLSGRLLLSNSISANSTSDPHTVLIGTVQDQNCTQDEHHCRFVWQNAVRTIFDRPCDDGTGGCHLNLVLDASPHNSNDNSRTLIIGQEDNQGNITQNNGRVNVSRIRPGSATPGDLSTKAQNNGDNSIPIRTGDDTLVISKPIPDMDPQEQLRVEFDMNTGLGGNYRTRTSTRIILTDGPMSHQSTPDGTYSVSGDDDQGKITPFNGFNCLPGQAPCHTAKAGVIKKKFGTNTADRWVNVLVTAAAPDLGGTVPGDEINATSLSLTTVRYAANLIG